MRRTTALIAAIAAAVPSLVAASLPEGLAVEDVRHVAHVPGHVGGHVAVEGDRLYAGMFGFGMKIFDISDRERPVEVGEWAPSGGRADAVPDAIAHDGKVVASLAGNRSGFTKKTEFLDVTDPADIRKIGELTGGDGDDHTGDFLDERLLWVPAGGPTLRLYDARPLFAATPEVPTEIGEWNLTELWSESPYRADRDTGGAFTHVHEITAHAGVWVDRDGDGAEDEGERRDLALVAEGGSYSLTVGEAGDIGSLFVVDITDPTDPVVLNRWMHRDLPPDEHHKIRYYHEARLLDGDPRTIIVSDEDLHSGCDAGGMTILRASADYTEATETAEWFNGTGTPAAICSVHNFTTDGTTVYIGSYNAGLQVLDLSDPTEPTRVGQYIAPGADSWGAQFHDGYVYVGDLGGRGLDVFQYVPDPVAEGWVASNPATAQVSGANESLCERGQRDAPTVDALIVPLPDHVADGASRIRATGSGTHAYDLNVYFYDASCSFISGVSLNDDGRDAEGPIPSFARYAAVTSVGINELGDPPVPAARRPVPPTYVRAQVLD